MSVISRPNPTSGSRPTPDHPDPQVPARADGVELLGELPGSGYRQPPALARRGDGQTIQLTPLLYLVLAAVDGRRNYPEIADLVSKSAGRLVSADNIRVLVEERLRPLGLLRLPDGSQPQPKKTNPLLGLRLRLIVSNPRVTRRITAPFSALFSPFVVIPALLLFGAVAGWLLFDKGLASATHHAFDQPGLLLLVFMVTVVSAGFHEFGHAAAARYGGATPGAMGVGLYLVWPAFYTDVTDSYRLGRGGRVRTDLGGLYFNAIAAVVMFGVWWITAWDALLLVIAAQLLQMVRQLAPLVRFDGYHVLADLTGVPDLYQRIKPTLLGLLPNHWGDAEAKVLKPWARAVVTVWVVAVVPILLVTLLLMVLAAPRVVATAWAALGREWTTLGANLEDGNLPSVLVQMLSVVAIVLPLLGMAYLLARVVRRVTVGVWRATRGRPARRAAALVTAAAVLTALTWAWMPDGTKYRPIQPNERGTVLDAVPVVMQAAATAGQQQTPQTTRTTGTASTLWPATGALPTAERPQLAVVLIPKSTPAAGPTPPTWVFPFNRPPAPRELDNQALAVNTADGSTLYEVAFALVWVTGETVDNRNEAYALASCRDCRTVAVAFQVLLVLGQANFVAPQNIAVALNYACVRCVTYALASQLVVTVPHGLSENAAAELAGVWAQLDEFGRSIDGVPVQRLQAELETFKSRILEIVQRDIAVAVSVEPSQRPASEPGSNTAPPAPPTTGGATVDGTLPGPQTPTTDPPSLTPTSTSDPAAPTTSVTDSAPTPTP
jgi:putative peptide zinc metalloprotease protein